MDDKVNDGNVRMLAIVFDMLSGIKVVLPLFAATIQLTI